MATANKAKNVERNAGGRPRHLERNELGRRIERLAARRHKHLDEIAEASGVSLETIYRISTGRITDPRVSTLSALAEALGVPVTKLIAPR
jgi:transcriptional regulator with XRE-family HTH domain